MMLIRSQDRKSLVPLNRPLYASSREIIYQDEEEGSNGWRMGSYASESRCLEILDEIQREFQYINHFSGSGVNSSDCQDWDYAVYQMPEK